MDLGKSVSPQGGQPATVWEDLAGNVVANPSQVDIVRGNVRKREASTSPKIITGSFSSGISAKTGKPIKSNPVRPIGRTAAGRLDTPRVKPETEGMNATETKLPKSKLAPTLDASLRFMVARDERLGPPPNQGVLVGGRVDRTNAAPDDVITAYRNEAGKLAHQMAEELGASTSTGGATLQKLEAAGLARWDRTTGHVVATPAGIEHVKTTSTAGQIKKAAPVTGTVASTLDRPRTGGYTGDIPANSRERAEHKPLSDHVKALTLAVVNGEQARALGFELNGAPMQPGDEVLADTFGKLRRGIVTRVGTKNARVAYATPSGGYMQETESPLDAVWRKVGEPDPAAMRAAEMDARRLGGERAPTAPKLTEEQKAAAKAVKAQAERERRDEENRRWEQRKIQEIRERGELRGVSDAGILALARAVGVPIPRLRSEREGLRQAIVDKVKATPVNPMLTEIDTTIDLLATTMANRAAVGLRGIRDRARQPETSLADTVAEIRILAKESPADIKQALLKLARKLASGNYG